MEKRAVAGFEVAAQAPLVHHGGAVALPGHHLLELAAGAVVEHEVVPVERGGDPAGGEGFAVGMQDLFAAADQAEQVTRGLEQTLGPGFAGGGGAEGEVGAAEQAVHVAELVEGGDTRGEVAAGDEEEHRLARGQEAGLAGAELAADLAGEGGVLLAELEQGREAAGVQHRGQGHVMRRTGSAALAEAASQS